MKHYVGEYVSLDHYGDEWSGALREYTRTDAWRGYYTTKVKNTVEVNSGSDLWGERTSTRDLAERIESAHKDGTLPVPVYVAVDLTSNVFATILSIQIASSNLEAFNQWQNGGN